MGAKALLSFLTCRRCGNFWTMDLGTIAFSATSTALRSRSAFFMMPDGVMCDAIAMERSLENGRTTRAVLVQTPGYSGSSKISGEKSRGLARSTCSCVGMPRKGLWCLRSMPVCRDRPISEWPWDRTIRFGSRAISDAEFRSIAPNLKMLSFGDWAPRLWSSHAEAQRISSPHACVVPLCSTVLTLCCGSIRRGKSSFATPPESSVSS